MHSFKGMPLVDIREVWFTDAGDMRPSKKGMLGVLDLQGAMRRHRFLCVFCHQLILWKGTALSQTAAWTCAGISLTVEQFRKLSAATGDILTALEGLEGAGSSAAASSSSQADAGGEKNASSKGATKAARKEEHEDDDEDADPAAAGAGGAAKSDQ